MLESSINVYYIPKEIVSEVKKLLDIFPDMVEFPIRELYYEGIKQNLVKIERYFKVKEELGELFDYSVLEFSFIVKDNINGRVTVLRGNTHEKIS